MHTQQIAARMPSAMLAKLDALAEQSAATAKPFTRTELVREAVRRLLRSEARTARSRHAKTA